MPPSCGTIFDEHRRTNVLRRRKIGTSTTNGRAITAKRPKLAFETPRGKSYHSKIEDFLESSEARRYRKKVSLIFTSPPFPLNRKKRYGNLQGVEYLSWLSSLAPKFADLLKPDGSIVIEVGNSWNPGEPTMSTLALESLLAFKNQGGLHLCQQFICNNPARLPSPAQWVNVERIRAKVRYPPRVQALRPFRGD